MSTFEVNINDSFLLLTTYYLPTLGGDVLIFYIDK